ncbi:MAG TPA: 8-amino-7-oxononanoate synthase [Steroidobacteraceae bacterium]|nr:8-amino-7-oxononanoate synthase [Steroidobacteraceae bacterium]
MKRSSSQPEATLARLKQEHLTRSRRTVTDFGEPGSRVTLEADGRKVVDFCSNDYLGLSRHPQVGEAMSQCAAQRGAGSAASHLVSGHGYEHARLEEALAEFVGRERALLFSTGYMANLAAITTFADRGETVLLDRLSHASLLDGALLSGARLKRYAHADSDAADRMLVAENTSVVATDGVFSMDGDLAPLPALAASSREHGAWLIVDDAHGLGVVGAHGRGSLEHFGLSTDDVPLLIGTLGKALGSFGAFVAGSREVVELLIHQGRSYIYTTALPQPVAAATRKALEISERESWRRARVHDLTRRFRAAAARAGIPLTASNTPIQPIVLGSSQSALRAQAALWNEGYWVVAIRPPTVPRGSARLRVTLSAAHTEAQVDGLAAALGRAIARASDGVVLETSPRTVCE